MRRIYLFITVLVLATMGVSAQFNFDIGVDSWNSPMSGCLTNNEDVIVVVKNYGLQPISSFTVFYTLNGVNSSVQSVNPAIPIPAGGSYTHTISAALNLNVGVEHFFNATVDLPLVNPDEDMGNNTFGSNISVKRFASLPFSFVEGFTSDESYYWSLNANADANAQFSSQTVQMNGGDNLGVSWVGTVANTTASNAWNDNTSYHSTLSITCDAGMTNLSPSGNLELVLKLKQEINASLLYSWFAVFVDGNAIPNTNAVTHFNPATPNSDPWTEQTFDLSAFSGSSFTLELKSSCKTLNDKVFLDDVVVRPRNEIDAGVSQILSPISNCGLSDVNNISVVVKNYGLEAITSNVVVYYKIDGGTEYIAGTVPGPIAAGGVSAIALFAGKQTPGLETVGAHQFTVYTKLAGDIYFPGNDALTVVVTNLPEISDFPYSQDFESTSYWTGGGVNSSWELGDPNPANPVINAAASGANSWMTNLNGNYNNNENSYLLGPCFDFSTLADPSIDFKIWYHTDANLDGLQLQSSINNGSTWEVVGTLQSYPNPDNWYNYSPVDVFGIGQPAWTDASGGWVTAHYSLTGLATQPNVKLRFLFRTDGDNLGGNPQTIQDYDGFAIDDILISDPQANTDIRVMEWLSPLSNYYMTANEVVSIRVKNLGLSAITSFSAFYSLNNGVTNSTLETFNVSIAPNDYAVVSFAQTADFSAIASYPCKVTLVMAGDENALNNVLTQSVESYPSVSVFPYFEDFQTNNHFWTSGGTNSSWEFGIPSGIKIPGDPEVNPALDSAWVTNLDGVYNNSEFSWVESPLIDFSSLIMPAISMRVAYDAEGYTNDGACVQYSVGGGAWTTLGDLGVPPNAGNWYINYVDGLSGEPAWTDESFGWVLAQQDFPMALGGQSDVKIRVLFGSDANTVFEGMAFDDIRIYENAPHDLAVSEWQSQAIACGLGNQEIITVKIDNLGYFNETNFDISYTINGGAPVVETVTATVPTSGSYSYSFTTPADMSAPGMYNCVVEIITIDSEMANNSIVKNLHSSPLISSFPYFEGFESGSGNWVSGGANSSWELGVPAATHISTAGSGTHSWVTNLSGEPNHLESSYVESPCFDFTGVGWPAIQFKFISDCEEFQSHAFDGAIIEFSTDGGGIWSKLGNYGDTTNWYNYINVWSFNNTNAWGGSSGGWLTAGMDVFSLANKPSVKFRFSFASDDSSYPPGTTFEGFGFDDVFVYNNAPFPILTFTSMDNICYLGTNGSIDVTITGGNTPYTFVWNDGSSTEDRSGLAAGTYSVTLTDDINQIVDTFIVIGDGMPYYANINVTQDILCYGGSNGALQVVVASGNSPYTYLWDNGSTEDMVSGLTAGTYCVTVWDADGCVAQGSASVGQTYDWGFTASYDQSHTVLINTTAQITVNGSAINPNEYLIGAFYNNGGVFECAGYIQWTGATAVFDIVGAAYLMPDGFAPGEGFTWKMYRIADGTTLDATVTYDYPFGYFVDGYFQDGGQTSVASLSGMDPVSSPSVPVCTNLSEPDEMIVTLTNSFFNGFNISCNGGANGQIIASTIGGVPTYSYSWDNSVMGPNNPNLVAGTYTVTVTDGNGCTKIESITLTEPALLTASVMKTDVSCNGYADGMVDITAAGGAMSYSYLWNTGSTTEDLVNVAAGVYSVTITDVNGCTFITGATLIESILLPLQEDFEAGVLPAGWESTHATPSMGWEFGNNLGTPFTFEIPSHTVYAGSNDDKYDDFTATLNDASMDYLITPPMDFTGFSAVNLTFDAFFPAAYYGSIATVEVSTDGGATWTVLYTLTEDVNWQEDLVVSLSAYVNMCNVRLAFHHNDSGNWASGFAIDNVNIIGTVHDLELTAWVSPLGDNCGLSNSEQVSIQVTNLGAQPATGFDLYYILNGTTYTETYAGTIAPGAMITHTFAAVDMSAFGTYTASAGLTYLLDTESGNDMITGIIFGNHPTIAIPYLEDFEDNDMEFFNQTIGSEASANIVNSGSNHALVVTGGSPLNGWSGGSNASANDAWVLNTSHQVSAMSWCNIDATGLGSLELLLDLQQTFSSSPLNSWFRVLINGVQVGPDYHPATMTDPLVTVQWDLDLFANTIFDLTLQFSNNNIFNTVVVDNIILREKLVDVAAVTITSPLPSCQYGATETVTVDLENLGGLPATGFDMVLNVDGVITTETYIGTIAPNGGTGSYSFTATADLSVNGPHTISVDVNIANDVNTGNDVATLNILSTPYYNTYPFAESAANFGSFWTAGGTNSSWVFSTDTWATTANSGNYFNEEMSWVVSPCFDFASLHFPVIEFDLSYMTEPITDNVVLQFSTNGGSTWTTIGAQGDNDNWYNDASGWTNSSGGILTVRHELFGLAGMSNVQFRMFFNSDDDSNMSGIAFANVEIYEQNDIGAIAFAPTGVCESSNFNSEVTIQNFGYSVIPAGAMVDAQYTLNGNTVNEMIALPATLNPGGTAILIFSTVENLMAGSFATAASATMVADFNPANNAMVPGLLDVYATPVLSLGADYSICDGSSTVLDAGAWSAYLWSDGSTDQTLTVTAGGTYSITITDANGCQNSDAIAIGIFPLPSNMLIGDVAFCSGESATLDPGAFTAYLWSGGSTDQTLMVTMAGTYSVTVTDANGCQNSDDALVTVYTLPAVSAGLDQSICLGETATLTAIGADTYLWNNGETTASIDVDPSVTTTYTVTGTENVNGCSASDDVVVNLNFGPIIDNAIQSDATCFGYDNGSIALSISGGVQPYTYIWTNSGNTYSANTFAISNLAPDTYMVTITDGGSCDATASFVISEPAEILVSVIDISGNVGANITCFNSNDGNVMALSTNGVGSVSYLWSNGATTQAIDNLAPGTYSVTVTDANGCMGMGSLMIVEPPELTAVVTTTDITCYGYNDGTASVVASGGTLPYSYEWNSNSVWNTPIISNLAGDLYVVVVTDANGCQIAVAGNVVEPPDLILTETVTSDYNGYGVSCFGASNGAAEVAVVGGIPAYSILWSNGATTTTNSNLVAGTYTVTVTDLNACAKTASVVITQPSPLYGGLTSPLHNGYNISCNGDSDGQITVAVYGGVLPYTYLWSNNATGTVVSGLTAGVYSVTATDANGCSISFNKSLTEPAVLTASTTLGNNVSCFGGANGQATVSANGGVALYSILWSSNANTLTATGLTAGYYTVTIEDKNGCTATADITITEPTAIIGSTQVTSSYGTYGTHITCFGSTDGSALAAGSGGTGLISYSWSNGENTAVLSNVGAGVYYVSITDANNCLYVDSVEIISPDEIILDASVTSDYNGNDVSCNGGSDGTGEVVATGGTGSLSYIWTTGATTASVSGLTAGIFGVTVTDENGCTSFASITLTEPTEVVGYITVSSNYHGQHISCNGAADGKLFANPSGGTPPYSYVWSTGGTDQEISGLIAGFYAVTIYDVNNCSSPGYFKQVNQPAPLVIIPTAADCFAGANGWATATPQGGTAPYSYLWSDGQTTQTATGFVAGSYDVTVMDVNGCTETQSFTLAPLQVSGVVSNYDGYSVNCFGGADGTIDLIPADGVPPYTYLWDSGATTEDVSGLAAGTHFVTVTDAISCDVIISFTLTEPVPIDAIASVTSDYNGFEIGCPGASNGKAIVNVVTGFAPYTYLWSTGSTNQQIVNLMAGTYTVTITDAHNCEGTASVTLNDPPQLAYTAVVTNADCNGASTGSIDITVTGGVAGTYLYFWNNNAHTQDISNLSVGYYYLLVLDANWCHITTEVFEIGQPTELLAGAVVTTDFDGYNVSCLGATDAVVDLTVSGGTAPYDYAWSNSESTEDLMNIGAGTYDVTVSDYNGCSIVVSVQVTEPDLFVATAEIDTDYNGYAVSCNGATDGEVSVVLGFGFAPFTYSWSNGSTEAALTGVGVGTYEVTVTDSHNCVSTSSVTLTGAGMLTLNAAIISDYNGYSVSCNGAADGEIMTTVADGTSPYTYMWNNGETTASITNAIAGDNTVTVTDANGCAAIATVTLTEPVTLMATAVSDTLYNGSQISCIGESDAGIDLTVSGGISPFVFEWSTGDMTEDLTGLGAGTYTVTVTDLNGCLAVTSFVVSEPSQVMLSVSVFNTPCYGTYFGSATAHVTGGTSPYFYFWSNNATTQFISGVNTGTYYVFALDQNLCASNTYPITFVQPTELVATADIIGINNCYGNANVAIDLSVSGGTLPYNYSWVKTGQAGTFATTQDISNLAAGTYTCTIKDANNCTKVVSKVVTQPSLITLQLVETHVNCYAEASGEIQVTVNNGIQPFTYSWSNGATVEDLIGITGGFYFLTVTDATGCTSMNGKFISEPNQLVLSLVTTHPGCNGSSNGNLNLSVAGGTAPFTYLWTTGATTQDVSGLSAGFYEVTVTDSHGCTERIDDLLVEPDVLAVSLTGIDINCNAGGMGTIDLTVSGGTTPYSYSWSNGSTTQDIAVSTAGTYNVTIADSHGCTANGTYTLGTASAISLAFASTPVTCNGGSDGTIDMTISNGVSPYAVMWGGIGQFAPFDWTYDNTGVNHSILVQSSIASNIGGAPLAVGDYLGVFYDNMGTLECGGYIQWTGNSVALAAWGADVGNDGFAAGEVFTWKVYRAATGLVFDATVSYMTMPNADTYVTNGISGISSITAGMSENLTGLTAGMYNVTVTDSVGCTGVDTYNVSQPSALLNTIVKTNVSCFGGNDGAINLSVIGGVGPYTYLWSNGATIQDPLNLVAGTYSVTITDANGCLDFASSTITEPAVLDFTWIADDVVCYGQSSGMATITISGGNSPFTTNWAGFDPNALAVGVYTVIVTDSKGCSVSHDITIGQPDEIVITGMSTNISCNGAMNGTIDISVAGGILPYTYLWSNGETTEDLSGLDAGMYDFTVTDANLCTMVANFTITQPDMLTVSGVTTDLSCFNVPIGAIDVLAAGGTMPYSFAWSNGASTEDLSGLFAGAYSLTITDDKGCVIDISFNIVEPTELVISGGVTDVTCHAGSDGAVDVTVNGGVQPYSFSWSNGAMVEDIDMLVAGSYLVTVTDANGCVVTATYTVNEPFEILLSVATTNVSCFGFVDGAIDLTVTNGVAPFTFAWTNGAATEDLSGLLAGNYEVVVTDFIGCTASMMVVVTEPAELALTSVVNNVSCYGFGDGSIDITVTGGTQPYTYVWSGLESVVFDWNYTNTGTNHTIVINAQTPIDLNGMGIANGDVIGVFYDSLGTLVCAGYVTWTGVNTNLAAWGAELNQGTGQLIMNGFAIGEEFKFKVWQASTGIVYDAVADYLPGFLDNMYYVTDGASGLASLTATIPYQSMGSSDDLLNLVPGAYHVFVTDANGCEIEDEFIISQPDEIVVAGVMSSFSGFGVSACGASDGTINVTVVGGATPLTYLWSNGATTEDLSGLAAGNYDLTVSDANGCGGNASFEITEFCNTLTLSSTSNNVTCNGGTNGSINLTINGGLAPFTILWNNSATTQSISGLGAGTYTVTVNDSYAQVATHTVVITQPVALSHTASIINASCYGCTDGAIDVTVSGGTPPYSYVWTNSAVTEDVTLLAAGLYGCQVTDANGCIHNMNFGIVQPAAPVIQIVSIVKTDIVCVGTATGSIDLTVSGGMPPYSYNWSNGETTQDLSGLTAGTYSVTVSDTGSPDVFGSATIIVSGTAMSSSYVAAPATCNASDGSIDMSVAGGSSPYSFLWSNGATTEDLTAVAGGVYDITVVDSNGCTYYTSAIVGTLGMSVTPVISTNTCNGDADASILIFVSGGTQPYSYSWSNSGTDFFIGNLTEGTYCVTVSDAVGCTFVDCYTVIDPDPIIVIITPNQIGLTATAVSGTVGSFSYLWSNGKPYQSIKGLTVGQQYCVTVTDSNGCTGVACYTWQTAPTVSLNGSNYKDDESTVVGDQSISLYPNPTKDGKFYLDLSNLEFESCVFEIMDATGRVVYNQKVEDNSNRNVFVAIENANVGVYHIRLITNTNDVLTKRIVIVK